MTATIGEKYLVETEPIYRPDVIFGFPRYEGMVVRWIHPDNGALYEKRISANAPLPSFERDSVERNLVAA